MRVAALVVGLALAGQVLGIYKEQAAAHWLHTNVGMVERAVYFQRQVIVAADGHLTAVHVRNGTMLWSRPLSAPVAGMDLSGDMLAVVTEDGVLRVWQAHDGAEEWSAALSEPVEAAAAGAPVLDLALVSESRAAVLIGGTVLGVSDGEVKWTWASPGAGATLDRLAFHAEDNTLQAISVDADGRPAAHDLSGQFGGSRASGRAAAGHEGSDDDDDDDDDVAGEFRDAKSAAAGPVLGTTLPSGPRPAPRVAVTVGATHVVGTADGGSAVYVLGVASGELRTVSLEAINGLSSSKMEVDATTSLHLRFVLRGKGAKAAGAVIDIAENGSELSQRRALSKDETAHSTPTTMTSQLMATSHALITSAAGPAGDLKLTVLADGEDHPHVVAGATGGLAGAFLHVYLKKGGVQDYRVMVQEAAAVGGRTVMAGKDKAAADPAALRTLWSKEALLADVVEVATVVPKAVGSADADGPAKFVRPTVADSAQAALGAAAWLATSGPGLVAESLEGLLKPVMAALGGDLKALTAKEFKRGHTDGVVVAATEAGWLYGLAMHDGEILWRAGALGADAWAAGGAPTAVSMHTVRPLGLHAATVVVVVSQAAQTTLLWVEPLTGVRLAERTVSVQAEEVVLLPAKDRHDHALVGLISAAGRLHAMAPDAAEEVAVEPFFHASVSAGPAGGVVGRRYDAAGGALEPSWRMGLGKGESLVAWRRWPKGLKVAGATHVTGERSILHKYINKNMLAVATYREEPSDGRGVVTLYLVDGVSGKTLHRSAHPNSGPKVHLQLADNDVWMSVWNQKARMDELVAMELYEKRKLDSVSDAMFNTMPVPTGLANSSHYGSKNRKPPTSQMHRYFVPAPVSALGITATAEGIASRQLLVGLTSDQVLAVDRRFINPRSPKLEPGKKPSAADQEEMLIPYNPMLQYIPTNVVSYTNAVRGLRTIATSPGESESISNMVVVGDDLLFVPLTPSGPFDKLGEDFNKPLLLLALTGLSVASVLATTASRQKMLKAKWQ